MRDIISAVFVCLLWAIVVALCVLLLLIGTSSWGAESSPAERNLSRVPPPERCLEDARLEAASQDVPLVAFVGQRSHPVPGCVTCRCETLVVWQTCTEHLKCWTDTFAGGCQHAERRTELTGRIVRLGIVIGFPKCRSSGGWMDYEEWVQLEGTVEFDGVFDSSGALERVKLARWLYKKNESLN